MSEPRESITNFARVLTEGNSPGPSYIQSLRDATAAREVEIVEAATKGVLVKIRTDIKHAISLERSKMRDWNEGGYLVEIKHDGRKPNTNYNEQVKENVKAALRTAGFRLANVSLHGRNNEKLQIFGISWDAPPRAAAATPEGAPSMVSTVTGGCPVCYAQLRDTDQPQFAVVPCGHCLCESCSEKIDLECPACRGPKQSILRVFPN